MTAITAAPISRTSRRSSAAVRAFALAWLIAPAPAFALNAYITNETSDNVSVIDTATNTVIATIPVGVGPFGAAVTPDGTKVYITNLSSNNVTVIDTATNTVIVPSIPVGPGPVGVIVTPDSSKVYVTNFADSSVSVIKTATNTVIKTITVGPQPTGVDVTPDGTTVYVAVRSSS
jgi:YVTN family beta-propeller protein